MLQPYADLTVDQAAPSYDLVDLATVKSEFSLKSNDTSKDDWLKRAISQSSAAIANYCNRVFPLEAVTETYLQTEIPVPYMWWGNAAPIMLKRWPVLMVTAVIEDGVTLVEGTDYRVKKQTGELVRLSADSRMVAPWRILPLTISYVAGYGVLASSAQTVPAASAYTITVPNGAWFSQDKGVTYANGTKMVAVASNPAAGQYSVAATGTYTFAAADASASVIINYTYTKVPDDLVDATLRLITNRLKSKDRDPALVSQNTPGVGEQRWWVGAVPGQSGTLPPEITGMLDGAYRVPVAV